MHIRLGPSSILAYDLDLYIDTSGTLGCGTYFHGSWFHYPVATTPTVELSIQWQDLFAILAATLTWDHLWSIRFICVNKAIVEARQCKKAKHPSIISLLCRLFLHATQHT